MNKAKVIVMPKLNNPMRQLINNLCKFHGITRKRFKGFSNNKRTELYKEYMKSRKENKENA